MMSEQRDTHELDQAEGTDNPPPEQATPPPIMTAPDEVYLELGRGANRVRIPLHFEETAEFTVGRGDESDPIELDLTPYGAFDHGVSRRHATLASRREGIHVTDLGSTNGTRINGFSLTAQRAYRLRNGDELEFGKLRLVVRFAK